ncbi:MAG: glycosyltransferase [Azoarcus sp.]|jgi:GT2 family glycosyltransferase/glycosyltransferase involved in cell wall biosynthesis|nr:glycosyltransferase [Azoarcus sp.]
MTSWREEGTDASVVDVVIPIRSGCEAAQRCLASLHAASCHTAREIVVVDDATEDAMLAHWLEAEADARRIRLLRNAERTGFAASANRGMALHPERDIVLLAPDIIVADGWLDRLVACAHAQADIGTVTPFCDEASQCTYPFTGWASGLPGTLGLAALDAIFAGVNAGQWLELPAAEKFCMLIRRACLDAVGYLDAGHFGQGCGEDQDFSRRAAAVGWHNALAANVFVHRAHETPPDPALFEAQNDAACTLAALYPDYEAVTHEFTQRDPAAGLRARVDRARAALGGSEFAAAMDERAQLRAARASATSVPLNPPRPVVLHIVHRKHDTRRWVDDYCAADVDCRNLVLYGRGSRNEASTELALIDPELGTAPLLTWTLENPIRATAIEHPEYAAILRWICLTFEVRAVLVSSLIGHSLDLLQLDASVVLIAHDLYPLCPALSATFGSPCTHCGEKELKRCLRENPYNVFWHVDDPRYWQTLRTAFAARLAADNVHIVAPDEDAHARCAALFPSLAARRWTCIPHGLSAAFARGPSLPEPDFSNAAVQAAQADEPRRLRVLLPGRLLPHEGLWLWREICDELRTFADVLLLGCGEFGLPSANYTGIEVIPECAVDELPAQVARWQPDCALLLAVLPESFAYTLAEMQALAVPVVATRVGSYVERIDSGWNGFLVEPETKTILDMLHALDHARERLATVVDILRFSPVRTTFDMVADYRRLLPELDAPAGGAPENLLATLGKRVQGQDEIARLQDLLRTRDEEARTRALNQRRLETMVGALAAQHAAILHSPSWKASAPVRALERLWDNVCHKFAPIVENMPPHVIRARGEQRLAPRTNAMPAPILRSRASARYWLCEAIGVPDSAIVIAGGGDDLPARALQNFVALADIVTRRNTRACFVWCGRLDDLCADDALVLKLLREVRDLFVLDGQLDAEVFAGADVLLLPTGAAHDNTTRRVMAGVPHVELPAQGDPESADGVPAATVTQLLQYCEGTEETYALQEC